MFRSLLERLELGLFGPSPSPEGILDAGYGARLRFATQINRLPPPFFKEAGFLPTYRPADSIGQGGVDSANKVRLWRYHIRLMRIFDPVDHYARVSRGVALKEKWRSGSSNKSGVHSNSTVVVFKR